MVPVCAGCMPYLRELTEMKKYQAIAVLLIMLMCASAHAEDESEAHVPSRAVWIAPMDGQAPWLDVSKRTFSPVLPEILSTGGAYAVVRLADGRMYAVDADYNILGAVVLPEGTTWFAVDAGGRLIAYAGGHILAANGYVEAANASGYAAMLDVSDVRAIDMAGSTLAYGDGANLSIVDLGAGTVKRIALADFFDDAKVEAMTPEVVEKSGQSKKSKKSKKQASGSEQALVADVQGIWWRADGVGLVSVRSLLTVRTFVTADNGRSWRQMTDVPSGIRRSFGWIWDGANRVLSRDGQRFVKACGEKYSPADRWTLSHEPEVVPSVSDKWLERESPEAVLDDSGNEVCADMGWLPEATATREHSLALDQSGLYAPASEPGGLEMGLYRIPEGGKAVGWIAEPGGALSSVDLPDGCEPLYVAGVSGLGLAFCKLNAEEFTVYTRTAKMPWMPETILPIALSDDPKVYMSEDGTLILRGACEETQREVPVMPEGEALASGGDVQTEIVKETYCRAGVRQPEEVGMPNIWRLENMGASADIVPLTNGRFVSVEPDAGDARKLVLRTSTQTEVVAESFDPEPYRGLVSTAGGCLALYDGSESVDVLRAGDAPASEGEAAVSNVKLLSTSGHLAELDCASSQAIAESGSETAYRFEEPAGEDRYGLRASAGAFFALKNVITWFARVEGLFPIYKGQYEVSVAYRISGGNVSSALGHIGMASIRWRYNNFELFDFAVGAGIGYGTMCGYDKKQDPAAMDEDDSTLPSGYSKCGVASMRYEISGFATYKFSDNWKLFLSAHLLGGESWGFDLAGGLEVRF